MTFVYPQSGVTNHTWGDAWLDRKTDGHALACRKCIYCGFGWCVTSGYWSEATIDKDKRECPAIAGMILDVSG
jgi:hypothetical protein